MKTPAQPRSGNPPSPANAGCAGGRRAGGCTASARAYSTEGRTLARLLAIEGLRFPVFDLPLPLLPDSGLRASDSELRTLDLAPPPPDEAPRAARRDRSALAEIWLREASPSGVEPAPRAPSPAAGWTVIEMLGIMAVLAILVMALVPLLMRELQRQAREREAALVRRLAEGYQQVVLNTRSIPGVAAWTTPVASQVGMYVRDVATNYVGNARVLVFDPAFRVGTNTPANLPYVQTIRGATNRPVSPRAFLISSLDKPLPPFLSGGGPAPAGFFESFWTSREDTPPVFWSVASMGDWRDVKLARINLDPLFVQLTLDYTSPLVQGRYSLDDTNCAASTNLAVRPFTTWLLAGTRLNLFSHSCANPTPLQHTEALFDTRSYLYQDGVWRARLFASWGGRKLNGDDLQYAYDTFMSAMPNPNAQAGRTQAQVTQAMMQFMLDYLTWAAGGFAGNKPAVDVSQDLMEDYTFDFTRHPPTM